MDQPLPHTPPPQPEQAHSSNWRSLGLLALLVGYVWWVSSAITPIARRHPVGILIFSAIGWGILLPVFIIFPSILGLDATGQIMLPILVIITLVFAALRLPK